ncbi:hypothetical protein WN943_010620 [Citrus x changshan-huyou]
MLAIQKAIRRLHTALDAPRLTRFSLNAPKNVEIEYANGSKFNLLAEYLRIHSPAADGKIRSVGGEKVIFGRRHVGIMSAEPVGNYGVSSLVKRSDDEPGVVCFRPPLEAEECYASHYLYNVSYNVNSVSPAPKMASHLGICTPCASEIITGFPSYRSPPLLRNRDFCGRIKAVADNRGSLDHLQRLSLNQSQPKKRAAPVSSPGIWDSFPAARTVQQMMETMERIMEDPFAYGVTWPSQQERVRVEESMLVIKAEKAQRNEANTDGSTVEEEEEWPSNGYGSYSTRIALPDIVEFEKIQAEVKDGVLYITIPKASSTAKIVDINVQ